MPRLLFEKCGNAVWISHLDLMRLFQRAFKRAGLPLTHTQGYNPRPSVSIALPLSVGAESCCELLDFDLDSTEYSNQQILIRLNNQLIDGVRVLQVYDTGTKIRELAYLNCRITMKYVRPVAKDAIAELQELFSQCEILVEKKTKNGIQTQNISEMIQSIEFTPIDPKTIQIDTLICCQNPTLNPNQILAAIEKFKPSLRPLFSHCCRMEIFDKDKRIFR